MAECLHCEINQLVEERIDQGETNLLDLAALVAESLVDLILLAPESDQPKIMAEALAHFGQTFLEKSGGAEASGATH